MYGSTDPAKPFFYLLSFLVALLQPLDCSISLPYFVFTPTSALIGCSSFYSTTTRLDVQQVGYPGLRLSLSAERPRVISWVFEVHWVCSKKGPVERSFNPDQRTQLFQCFCHVLPFIFHLLHFGTSFQFGRWSSNWSVQSVFVFTLVINAWIHLKQVSVRLTNDDAVRDLGGLRGRLPSLLRKRVGGSETWTRSPEGHLGRWRWANLLTHTGTEDHVPRTWP